MHIKVRFLKDGKPCGREYTHSAPDNVRAGDEVILPSGGNGVVTEVNVPEESIADFKDKVKEICGVVEEGGDNQTESV